MFEMTLCVIMLSVLARSARVIQSAYVVVKKGSFVNFHQILYIESSLFSRLFVLPSVKHFLTKENGLDCFVLQNLMHFSDIGLGAFAE